MRSDIWRHEYPLSSVHCCITTGALGIGNPGNGSAGIGNSAVVLLITVCCAAEDFLALIITTAATKAAMINPVMR